MILIPTGTDAPIYHWPRATVAVIVLNVAAFVAVPPRQSATTFDDNGEEVVAVVSDFDRYALALGDGLHPAQWVTHNFLHLDVFHLIGNLVFLWAFGLVVEGKLGTVKYLLTYLAIGTLHGALTQTLLLRSGLHGHAAGASAVVFGLLAICMVWAPRNELNCTAILMIGFRVLVYHWDFYFTTVALLYIGEQVLGLALGGLTGRAVVTEMGHLSGAFWGTVLAVGLLKAGLVDCEGWDVFSLVAKRRSLARQWKARGESLERSERSLKAGVKAAAVAARSGTGAGVGPDPEERAAAAVRRVHKLIDMGDTAGALAAYDKAARTLVAWPPQADLYALIKAMHARKAEADSVRLMRDHCRYYPAESGKLRLKLAQVLIQARQRPTAALRVLAEIPPNSLPAELETARRKLARQAAAMQDDGVLELEGDD